MIVSLGLMACCGTLTAGGPATDSGIAVETGTESTATAREDGPADAGNAENQPVPAKLPDGNALKPPAQNTLQNPAQLRARRTKLMAALLAVSGIVVLGIGLTGGILLWSRRLRRINRRPLPEAGVGDELWFLRTQRPEMGSGKPAKGDDDQEQSSAASAS